MKTKISSEEEARVLTEQEEQVIRLHHHDFDGYSIENTAAKMGITVTDVTTLLRSAKKKAPQMFPILTARQRAIIAMYDEHLSRATIAAGLDITLHTLGHEIVFLREHGFLFNRTMSQYDESIDGDVKEKF